jgi:hypothetical protein
MWADLRNEGFAGVWYAKADKGDLERYQMVNYYRQNGARLGIFSMRKSLRIEHAVFQHSDRHTPKVMS